MAKPVVVITGASQGIGASIAKVFAKEIAGVRLALVARNEKNLTKTKTACAKLGATVTLSDLDYTFDGTPKSATAVTDPAGLNLVIT